jgi:glycosyltransferase involved in cell wall biosynthesis
MSAVSVTAFIPAHNPNKERLRQTLAGLRRQTLQPECWETLLVDNASSEFPDATELSDVAPSNLRVVREPAIGLTSARLKGIRSSAGAVIVMVDDDNVLAPDYLAQVAELFAREPRLGAAGGRSIPEFEVSPAPHLSEFLPLLAIRDLGNSSLIATTLRPEGSITNQYPLCAPIGAGMALRREAALEWADEIANAPKRRRLDRTGPELVSGGDNDIVMTLLEKGFSVGYFPSLNLSHLIPAARLDARYLARLNRAIQKSWVQVLAMHGANPWPRIAPWTVIPRKMRSYLGLRAWSSDENFIRWQGICGLYEGRASI